MTEMLHIFLSNRPGEVRPGTTGVAVPGYDLQIRRRRRRARSTRACPGTLFVRGDVDRHRLLVAGTTATRQVFQGEWLRTGDTYVARRGRLLHLPRPHRRHAQGERHLGLPGRGRGAGCSPTTRSPRRWSSPRPTPTVWRSRSRTSCCAPAPQATEDELIAFCRDGLPSFKRPRRVVFVDALPDHRDRQDPPGRAARMAATVLIEALPPAEAAAAETAT